MIEFEADVCGKLTTGIRDTGSTTTIVRSGLVPEHAFTGKHKYIKLANSFLVSAPVAKVDIVSSYYTGSLEVCTFPNPLYDLILGNNICGISQIPTVVNCNFEEVNAVETRSQKLEKALKPLTVSNPLDIIPTELRTQQQNDESLQKIRDYVSSGTVIRTAKDNVSRYIVQDGLIYREFSSPSVRQGKTFLQVVVPKGLRPTVMSVAHDCIFSGHMGVQRTLDRVLSNFYWPGVHGDVVRFCRSCCVCQKTVDKGRVPPVPLSNVPLIDVPFKRIAIDLVGPITPMTHRKNRYILTAVDYATRYPEAVALKDITTERVADALVSIFSRVGIPEEVLSDQGTQFTSGIMKEVSRLLSVKQLVTTPYHPQCNGLVERFNGTLKKMLKRVCEE